eukprot:gene31248-20970_t
MVARNCDASRRVVGVWFLLAVESIGATCDLVDWEGQALASWWHAGDECTQSHLPRCCSRRPRSSCEAPMVAVLQELHDALLLEMWRRWERDQPH